MLMVKMLRDNKVCVIDDGISYLFDIGGRLIQEDAGLAGYADGAMELPAISILSSNNHVEVCTFKEHSAPQRYSVSLDAMSCAMKVQQLGGYLRMLRRDGKSNDIRFNQLIFIYREGTNLDNIISSLGATKEV